MLLILDSGDGGAAKVSDEEDVRETAAERRQRRMKEKLEKAKLRKKALFDNEYDALGNSADGKSFFDEWKSETELQAKVGISEYFATDSSLTLVCWISGVFCLWCIARPTNSSLSLSLVAIVYKSGFVQIQQSRGQ